ncbi:hypothetical protein SLUN_01190 [Streptomyces lunaelactis]|uniref:Uncharacterized protein n=1 Tax=Streptomyces lunaelactis TaxID=1535768 RepID=A0A2R4SW22_9ACTN|nr:hypothetical protein SLUN_01190 [Streptomyces lunaelactis]
MSASAIARGECHKLLRHPVGPVVAPAPGHKPDTDALACVHHFTWRLGVLDDLRRRVQRFSSGDCDRTISSNAPVRRAYSPRPAGRAAAGRQRVLVMPTPSVSPRHHDQDRRRVPERPEADTPPATTHGHQRLDPTENWRQLNTRACQYRGGSTRHW